MGYAMFGAKELQYKYVSSLRIILLCTVHIYTALRSFNTYLTSDFNEL